MVIKQDPMTGLYCREDGAVLMPPDGHRFRKFRWTFGSSHPTGYRVVGFQCKGYLVHQIVCRAFNGLSPEDKPFVDHINRTRGDNRPENLHWVDRSENNENADSVDRSIAKFGVRASEDKQAYMKTYHALHREEGRARSKAYYAAKKAAGFVFRVINGKHHWIQKELA